MGQEECVMGLREDKRARTRDAIAGAALSLALEKSLNQVTIEAIAEKVFISPRTVSNYFACKEQAVLSASIGDLRHVGDDLRRRPPHESPLQALLAVLVEFTSTRSQDELRLLRAKEDLVMQHPQLLPFQAQQYAQLERLLRTVIAERLDVNPDGDGSVWLTAAAAVCAVKLAVTLWQGSDSSPGDLTQCLERAFDVIAEGLPANESALAGA
jgi:AcrR family transcriptional regulator